MTYITATPGLPDPAHQGEFYRDVVLKRFLAWIVDFIMVFVLTVIVVLLTAGLGVFIWGLIFLTIDFLYRWIGLSRKSATLGQRLVSLEYRKFTGERFDVVTAFLHTLGYMFCYAGTFFVLQVVSIAMVLITPRRQNLPDMILGTAAINRAADR